MKKIGIAVATAMLATGAIAIMKKGKAIKETVKEMEDIANEMRSMKESHMAQADKDYKETKQEIDEIINKAEKELSK